MASHFSIDRSIASSSSSVSDAGGPSSLRADSPGFGSLVTSSRELDLERLVEEAFFAEEDPEDEEAPEEEAAEDVLDTRPEDFEVAPEEADDVEDPVVEVEDRVAPDDVAELPDEALSDDAPAEPPEPEFWFFSTPMTN